jgi:hypothetical protein
LNRLCQNNFCAFEYGVSVADRIGESFIGKIVEFGCDIGGISLSHGSSPWLGSEPVQELMPLARLAIFQYQLFMARSISNIRKKRGRGRPKIGAIPVMVRLLPDQAARLDEWRKNDPDKPGRPEAIRRLLERSLPPPPKRS